MARKDQMQNTKQKGYEESKQCSYSTEQNQANQCINKENSEKIICKEKNGVISFLDIDKVKSESGLQSGKSAIRHLWTE